MKLLLYCTKAKPILRDYRGKAIYDRFVISQTDRPFTSDDTQPILNGKIVAECDFEVEEIYLNNNVIMGTKTLNSFDLVVKSKVEIEQMRNYLKGENGYAIHIKNLKIFDEPKELSEYYTRITDKDRMNEFDGIDVIFPDVRIDRFLAECVSCKKLEKAPQNIQRIVLLNKDANEYEYAVLISIQPQWLCKILNGEKTIEVRKKVLKGMIK